MRGELLGLEAAAKRVGMTAEPFRRLVKAGKGPPATKRPGSNRWLFWANEVDAWFDSGRVNPPLVDRSQAIGQTH